VTRLDDESKANSCFVHTCLTPKINTGRPLKNWVVVVTGKSY